MVQTLVVLILWGLFILGSLFFLNYFAGESKVKTFSVFLFFLVILSVVYSPGITGHYLFHDDVYLWAWQKTNWATHPQYAQQGLTGRPLAKIIMFSIYSLVDTISSANFARFFTIVIISLIALAIDIWFRRVCDAGETASFLISLAIVVLPPFQIYVNWITAFFIPVATLLSIYSAMLLLKPERNRQPPLNYCFLNKIKEGSLIAVFFSLLLLLCSLMTYQPGVTYFIALLAIWLIGKDCRDMNNIKWPWLHLAIFFIAASIYFLFFKISVPANAVGGGTIYNNSFASDYAGKLWWFFQEPMVAALNLWHIFPSRTYAGGVLFIIFLGVVLEFFYLMKSSDNSKGVLARNFLLKHFIILFLIFLSFSVNFAVHSNVFFYRTIPALTTIVFILFWSGIRRILAVSFKQERYEACATVVLFLICVCGMFSAYTTFRKYCVDSNARELRYIENELAQKYNSNIKQIYINRPSRIPSPQVSIADEFGYTTCCFPQDVPWLFKAALQEKRILLQKNVAFFFGTFTGPFPQDPHLLIIDLNRT